MSERGNKGMDVAMDSVLRATKLEQESDKLLAQESRLGLQDDRRHRKIFVTATLALTVGIVVYYASGVYGMRLQYPRLFAWYDRMRRDPALGRGPHSFSMYQVCTAANYGAVQGLFELLFIWRDLRAPAANFLMLTVNHFEDKARSDATMRLAAQHWSGTGSVAKLVGDKGWASTGCGTGTLDDKKETLCSNWNRSAKEGNLWYPFFPQPVDEVGKRAFLAVPVIAELYTDSDATGGAASACDEEDFKESKLGRLFNEGLCGVAFKANRDDEAAGDLFNTYFAAEVSAVSMRSCKGAIASGGTQGALTGGMTGLMLEGMVGGPAAAILTAGLATVSGITGAAAARERCKNEGGEA